MDFKKGSFNIYHGNIGPKHMMIRISNYSLGESAHFLKEGTYVGGRYQMQYYWAKTIVVKASPQIYQCVGKLHRRIIHQTIEEIINIDIK